MNIYREIGKRITPFMHENGFVSVGRNYYYLANNIAFCISFDMPSGQMYATAYIMPLYIPCVSRYYTYGNRLNYIHDVRLPLLSKESDKKTIDEWCNLLCHSIDKKILPLFQSLKSIKELLKLWDGYSYSATSYFACHEMYIWRLKMFSFLYIGDFANLEDAITHYREVLSSVSFLSAHVIESYTEEINVVESLIHSNEQTTQFFATIESNTRGILC